MLLGGAFRQQQVYGHKSKLCQAHFWNKLEFIVGVVTKTIILIIIIIIIIINSVAWFSERTIPTAACRGR
jgi:hypothetical protein